MTAISFETCTGSQIIAALPALARLRIEVFREWPYLYDGDEAYERDYLQVYSRCRQAAVILARDGSAIVGASSCMPMREETAAVREPLEAAGLDVNRFFYFGESVLLPDYRGQGIGVKFFEARERAARDSKAQAVVFCAVRRPENHPARPRNISDMPRFWRRRGFVPLGISCQLEWKEPDRAAPLVHDLDFWSKKLGLTLPGDST